MVQGIDVAEGHLHHLLWAKADKSGKAHPLVCHLIDVAQVAQALWDAVLADGMRDHLASILGVSAEETGRLLAFWAGLHDIGKASPGFQRSRKAAASSLAAAGLPFPKLFRGRYCPHATISASVLPDLLETETGLEPGLARLVARALGGHHGAWPPPGELQRARPDDVGGKEWTAVRRQLLRELKALSEPPSLESAPERLPENTLLTLLSGLCVVADWVGSMEEYFPYATTPVDTSRYADRATAQARRALDELGWAGWAPPTESMTFQGLFELKPRPMQEAVAALAERLTEPGLVIIEAPTGTGKTEAALYLADRWANRCQQRGLYVAMPTMATSNQMFHRVREVLARRYPDSLVNLHLIHGQARWREDMENLRLGTAEEREGGTVAAMAWFLPRKRTLLAPFGVGTVDQALLSVLQTRHFFLRLFGLSHKTVVFDEVHAYDTYMSAIFQRLLGWLRRLGTSVVLLSATLPRHTRRRFVEAYSGATGVLAEGAPYPAVTWAAGGQTGVIPLEGGEERAVLLQWVARDPEAIAKRLAGELSEGGCTAVICNTVGRAQDVYRTLRQAGVVSDENLHLFHARFPLAWRQEIEDQVLSAFGKQGRRPRKAVVVATQVIEQSLDLDFDLMISDLAPVDLLIQRAGRLHRHEQESRPSSCAVPRLLITRPAEADGVPDFGPDVHVYEPYVLLRSFLALQGRDRLALPADTVPLIEAVYGDDQLPPDVVTPELAGALAEAQVRMRRHEEEHVYKAQMKLVPHADADDLLDQRSLALEEDNPELHEAFRALTRLAPPGISLVCLHRNAGGLSLEPDGGPPYVDLKQPPDVELTRQLAYHAVTVRHYPVVEYFLAQPVPAGWKDHPLLHSHRPAIFDGETCDLEGIPYTLQLTRQFGLEIERKEA